jgi:hypothetical protein
VVSEPTISTRHLQRPSQTFPAQRLCVSSGSDSPTCVSGLSISQRLLGDNREGQGQADSKDPRRIDYDRVGSSIWQRPCINITPICANTSRGQGRPIGTENGYLPAGDGALYVEIYLADT